MRFTRCWFRALFVVLLVVADGTASAGDARGIFKAAAPSVVLVRTYATGHVPLKIGSGFFVEGDALVTNAHVIAGASEVEIMGRDGIAVPVTSVLSLKPEHDLVLLAAKGVPLQLSTRSLEVGETVFALGNPKGLEATFSNGIVSALRTYNKMPVVQITAPISPGSSGGPIIDENGLVVGVASFGYREGQSLNFGISSSNLVPLMATLKPMSLSVAVYRLQEAESQGAMVHGAGSVTVVRILRNNGGGLSVSIKNAETSAVHQIVLRLLFYEDLREAKIKEIDAKLAALGPRVAGAERLSRLVRIREILDKDFRRWSAEERAVLDEWDMFVTVYPKSITNTSTSIPQSWVNSANQAIAASKIKLEREMAASGLADSTDQGNDFPMQVKNLQVERQQLQRPSAEDDFLPVDYADYLLSDVIAPGLTKTFFVKAGGGVIKPSIIDYIVVDK